MAQEIPVSSKLFVKFGMSIYIFFSLEMSIVFVGFKRVYKPETLEAQF